MQHVHINFPQHKKKKREYRHSQIIPSSLWHNFKKLGNIRCYKRDPSNIQPVAASVVALEPSSNDAGDKTPSDYAWTASERRVGLHLGQRLNAAYNGRLNGACSESQQPLKSRLNGVWMPFGTAPENDPSTAPKRCRNDAFWSPTWRHWLAEWRPALLRSLEVAPEWRSSRRCHLLCSPMTLRVAWLGAHNNAKAVLLTSMRRCLIVA